MCCGIRPLEAFVQESLGYLCKVVFTMSRTDRLQQDIYTYVQRGLSVLFIMGRTGQPPVVYTRVYSRVAAGHVWTPPQISSLARGNLSLRGILDDGMGGRRGLATHTV